MPLQEDLLWISHVPTPTANLDTPCKASRDVLEMPSRFSGLSQSRRRAGALTPTHSGNCWGSAA